jgi:hypothetical protein
MESTKKPGGQTIDFQRNSNLKTTEEANSKSTNKDAAETNEHITSHNSLDAYSTVTHQNTYQDYGRSKFEQKLREQEYRNQPVRETNNKKIVQEQKKDVPGETRKLVSQQGYHYHAPLNTYGATPKNQLPNGDEDPSCNIQ